MLAAGSELKEAVSQRAIHMASPYVLFCGFLGLPCSMVAVAKSWHSKRKWELPLSKIRAWEVAPDPLLDSVVPLVGWEVFPIFGSGEKQLYLHRLRSLCGLYHQLKCNH